MPHEYSAEIHDWDLTLRAAWSLLMSGQAVLHLPTPGSPKEKEFSCFTGSMLLSHCAIESFSASIAFCMEGDSRFGGFDYRKYRIKARFWERIELIWEAIPYKIDKSKGLFQRVAEMQEWRNVVTHSRPYRIERTQVENTNIAPRKLHVPFHREDYVRNVGLKQAMAFYNTALDYIDLLGRTTGLNPRARATFSVGPKQKL